MPLLSVHCVTVCPFVAGVIGDVLFKHVDESEASYHARRFGSALGLNAPTPIGKSVICQVTI